MRTRSDPLIAVLISDQLRHQLFTVETWQRLDQIGEIRLVNEVTPGVDLMTALTDASVCVTGWDTPPLPSELFHQHSLLGMVAHTGGSVRWLVPEVAFDYKVRITQTSAVLAEAVAEFTVMAIIAGLRDAVPFATALRNGEPWSRLASRPPGQLLREQVVGIVGASRTGRATAHRLQPFGCRILVADPFLTDDDAAAIGVAQATLDELVQQSDVVSLHAPVLPQTIGMLGARQIAAMRPGTLVVNTARAALVDNTTLLDAARAGQIRVIADVFDEEPLDDESPWRTCPGVVATPHIAALTRQTLFEQGSATVDDIVRYFAGEPLLHEVTRQAYFINA